VRGHLLLTAMLAALAAGVCGCSETSHPEGTTAPAGTGPVAMLDDPCGDPTIVTLWAGQFIDAGTVTVSNDAELLSVEIVCSPGWYMTETHVAVARTLEDLPQTGSGNPIVGHFDLATDHDPAVATFTYEISIAEYGYQLGDPLVLAVHAIVNRVNDQGAVVQTETAWGDGLDFPGRNWATYIEYTVQECVTPPACWLELDSPNGGSFCLGSIGTIAWHGDGEACGTLVRIDLLYNGVACDVPIAESAPNIGTFEWEGITGCAGASGNYSIRVTDLESGASDESNAPFVLLDCGGE